MLFATLGLINAIFARNFDDVSIVPHFVLTPLTYFGGVFYSISLLPPFWQSLSQFNPVFYIINGFRFGVLGAGDVSLTQAFVVVSVLTLAAMATALHLLNRGTRLWQKLPISTSCIRHLYKALISSWTSLIRPLGIFAAGARSACAKISVARPWPVAIG